MSQQNPPSRPLITADGELTIPLPDSAAPASKPNPIRRIALVVFVVIVLFGFTLWLCDHFQSEIVAAALTPGILVLIFAALHLPFIRAQFERVTFPFREIEQRRDAKNKGRLGKGRGDFQNSLEDDTQQYTDFEGKSVFLLYRQHTGRLKGHSRFVRKYAYNGEVRFVYSVFLVPCLGMILAMTALLWTMMGPIIFDLVQIHRLGVPTPSVITNCEKWWDGVDLTVTYTTNDKALGPFTTQVYIPNRTCIEMPVGSFQQVIYLAPFPDANHVSPSNSFFSAIALLAFFVPCDVVLLLLFMGTLWRALTSDFRFRHLQRNGVICTGQIVGYQWDRSRADKFGGDTQPILVLQYRFLAPDGREFTTTQRVPGEVWGRRGIPKAGTPVAVLYADDANFKLL